MQIGAFSTPPRRLLAAAKPQAAPSTTPLPADSVHISAPAPLESLIIGPKFAAFSPIDASLGTIRCNDLGALKARAQRLEKLGIRLIGVRHGESEANANGGGAILSGRGDSPLTENGRKQAEQAAGKLLEDLGGGGWLAQAAANPNMLPVLVASPLSRAYDTGVALREKLVSEAEKLHQAGRITPAQLENVRGLQLDREGDLQEISFGQCEGLNAKDVAQTYPNFGKGVDFTHRFPGGEAGLDVMERMDAFLNRVEERHAGRTVIFFGHTMSLGLGRVLLGEVAHNDKGCLFVDRSKIPNATPIPFTQPGDQPNVWQIASKA